MRTVEMILLTKSSKYGQYCIAGFECRSGCWIRLISDDEQTHGAVSEEMLYDPVRGRSAKVLDRVRVQIADEQNGQVQTENLLIDTKQSIRILSHMNIRQVMRLHPCERRDALFGSHQSVVEVDVGMLGHSLEFIRADNVRVYRTFSAHGKLRHKVDFEYGGRKYSNFALTDPEYYNGGNRSIDRAALVLSISDDAWSRLNGHYIYTAKIFELGKSRGTRKIDHRKRFMQGMLLAALLVVIAAGIVFLNMDKAYVPPYSGARYHLSESCSRLSNREAAYRMPIPLCKLFFVPCEQCVLSEIRQQ